MASCKIKYTLALVAAGLVMMLVLLPGRGRGAGGAALLHVLCLAPLLQGLLGHVLLDVLALLPGHGVAHLVTDVTALLIVLELGHGGGRVGALLLGDLVTNLARVGHVLTNLFGNLVADPAVDRLALALIHLLGVDLRHEGAVAPGLLL